MAPSRIRHRGPALTPRGTRVRIGPVAMAVASVFLATLVLLLFGPWTLRASAVEDRPDLLLSQLSNPPSAIEPGESFRVTSTVKNVGRAQAGGSTTRFYLSRDKLKGSSDVRFSATRWVGRLGPGETARSTTRLTVPSSTPERGYYVIACADDLHKVGEANEGNNCRVPAGKVLVSRDPFKTAPPFHFTPNPLTVSPTLEMGRAITATLTPEGGTLPVTASDGTKFTLTLPKDALLSDQEITMTPVAKVGGLPLSGGLVAAVDIKPEGLLLYEPAKLTIEPSTAPSLAQQTGFSWHGSGKEFHLRALDFGNQLSFEISHFSSYGVGLSTQADRTTQIEKYPPTRPADQYLQASSELLKDQRVAEILGQESDPGYLDKMADLTAGYYRDVVRPKMLDAQTDDALAISAIQEGVDWVRQVQLLGLDTDPAFDAKSKEVFDSFKPILRNAFDSFGGCTKGEVGEAQRMMGLGRFAYLNVAMNLDDAFTKIERCVRFELDFETTMFHDPYSSSGLVTPTSTVHVRVPGLKLWLTPDFTFGSSSKQLEYLSWEIEDQEPEDCLTVSKVGIELARPFVAKNLAFSLNLRAKADGTTTIDPPTDVELLIDLGWANEKWNLIHGCGSDIVEDELMFTYYDVFRELHESEYVGNSTEPFKWAIGNWNYVGGNVWVEKKYSDSKTEPYHFYSEETTFQLRHTPVL